MKRMLAANGAAVVVTMIAAALSFGSGTARAQSFNCRQAHRADERVICNRHRLSRLDRRMSRKYYRIRRHVHGGMRRELEREQRAWLRSRHDCGHNAGCIRRHYRTRIGELNSFRNRARRIEHRYGYR